MPKKRTTQVLVIGGGATGCGILRDLALRGIKATLVERHDLASGTTGRYHGLLHSGARYVIKDPPSARDCARENEILRRIAPHCIEDTGGYFVTTPADDPAYSERFLAACQECQVPCEEIPPPLVLRAEPRLTPHIIRAFAVRDAAADSFLTLEANARSARDFGAEVLTYHKVLRLLRAGSRIHGAVVEDRRTGETLTIEAEVVVNAAGAWAGQIGALAGVPIAIVPGKGTLVAMNHRLINSVVNRCKMPSDGDIIVPIRTVCVLGTTDIEVDDPDDTRITRAEVALLLREAEVLVPGISQARVLRAWAGVRPLYRDSAAITSNRDISRDFKLLDHRERDGVSGLVSIVGGKYTTYRLMAERTVDLVCRSMNVSAACRTHLEPLAPPAERRLFWMGAPLAQVEQERSYGSLICECELVTRSQLEQAIAAGAANLDDLRRDLRLGMGPCQGGFCTYRAAGLLYERHPESIAAINLALADFLQERWRGLTPILWGDQLRQERLDELIYLSILAVDRLPVTSSRTDWLAPGTEAAE